MVHHPGGCGEVEHARRRRHGRVKEMLLLVLKKCAASGVDDGLGKAGRAARVENIERVGGWQLLELEGCIR